mmetsp:Transcript_18563/g.40882  ORF Transcript_18563/g.40882 Transcript_18563/m.40882 type:complete len:267 (-) Transcript_18563:145-945(-)
MTHRLVESTVWKEDTFLNGHKTVWGSWYDTEAKKWGFACCKSFDKGGSCSSATQASKPKKDDSSANDSSSDDGLDSEERERREKEKPFDWSNPPPDLLPKAEVRGGEAAFIEHFVRWSLGAWRKQAEAAEATGGGSAESWTDLKMVATTESGLAPLLQRLKIGKVPKDVLVRLDKMASAAYDREYQICGTAYMELSLGHKKWNNVFAGANAMNTNKGARITIIKQDTLLAYDSDPVAQRYIQAARKITQFVQSLRPNEDASKNIRT